MYTTLDNWFEPNVWDVISFDWWGVWIQDWEYRLELYNTDPYNNLEKCMTKIRGGQVGFWLKGGDEYTDWLWQFGVFPSWYIDYDIRNIKCDDQFCKENHYCVGAMFSPRRPRA